MLRFEDLFPVVFERNGSTSLKGLVDCIREYRVGQLFKENGLLNIDIAISYLE